LASAAGAGGTAAVPGAGVDADADADADAAVAGVAALTAAADDGDMEGCRVRGVSFALLAFSSIKPEWLAAMHIETALYNASKFCPKTLTYIYMYMYMYTKGL